MVTSQFMATWPNSGVRECERDVSCSTALMSGNRDVAQVHLRIAASPNPAIGPLPYLLQYCEVPVFIK